MATNILDNIDTKHLGGLLQKARKKCGMTQADAAKVINAARTTIVAIEKGDRRLRPGELIALARAYGTSVSYFVRPRPVVESFQVQFRAAYKRNEEERTKIEPVISELEELCQNYLELEEIVETALPQNYPREYSQGNAPIKTAAESIAIAERQRLGLGDGPILLLRDLLEQRVGLRIFYLKMPAKYSEIYNYDERLGGCMAINANHPEERRRWSLARGYLHFLAHRRKAVLDFDGQYQRIPESERLETAFPQYFLMPTSGLLKQFNDICREADKFTPASLLTLAHYYGVSVEALARRLENMELLRLGTYDKLRDRGLMAQKVQQELGKTEIPQRADLAPIHYQHLAIEALDRGLITEGRFADFLKVDRLEARRIVQMLRERSGGTMEEEVDFDLSLAQESREVRSSYESTI